MAGVPDELYWQTTPPERAALLQAADKREQRMDRRFAFIATRIANENPYRKGGPVTIDHFLGRAGPPVTQEDRKRLAHRMGPTRSVRSDA